MENKVAPFAATPDPTYGRQPSLPHGEGRGSAAGGEASGEQELRLVIEYDAVAGTAIYKVIDRRTGAVVQQYLRDQVLQMGAEADYSAGGVIRTKA